MEPRGLDFLHPIWQMIQAQDTYGRQKYQLHWSRAEPSARSLHQICEQLQATIKFIAAWSIINSRRRH